MKVISLPRLELFTALLLTRTVYRMIPEFNIKIIGNFLLDRIEYSTCLDFFPVDRMKNFHCSPGQGIPENY